MHYDKGAVLMEMALTEIPYQLFTGRTIIHVTQGIPAVCRVSQVYPIVEVEQAANSTMLTQGMLLGRNSAPDGYYHCPLELTKWAEFSATFEPRELFLLCTNDWQTYSRQQGYDAVKYRVLADGGFVDDVIDDARTAFDKYQNILGQVHIQRLYVQLYTRRGDVQPQEEFALLAAGEFDDLF